MARVAAGMARVGVNTGPSTLVQEAALEGRAVSFEKGCYLGQETVARLQFRGRANRALRGLVLDGPAGPGTSVAAGGKEVGASRASRRHPTSGRSGWRSCAGRSSPAPWWRWAAAAARVVGLPFGSQ